MSLHPGFPVIEGHHRFTREWALELPGEFNRRVEEEGLVIWRPGLTFWIAAWDPEPEGTTEDTLAWILDSASPERTDEALERGDGLIRLTYRQREHDPQRRPPHYTAISGYVIGAPGHVQISAYCDGPGDIAAGEAVIRSVRQVE